MFRQAHTTTELQITRRHSARTPDAAFLRGFARWDWSALSVFVSEALPETVWACAQGDRIVLSARLLRACLTGRIPRGLLAHVVWHELAHIWQQAELAAALGPRRARSYVRAHAARLEAEADLLARRFAAESRPFPTSGPAAVRRPLCPAAAAPVQAWMVSGGTSKALMASKVPNETLEALRNSTNLTGKFEIEIYGPINGAHETFTADACEVVAKLNEKLLNKEKIAWLEAGSKFNDVRFYHNVTFSYHYLIQKDDAFINQSHEGDMQFLHSMGSSEGDYALDRRKILRWTKFCLDVFNDRKLQVTRLGDYVFEQLEPNDLLLPMLASLLVSPEGLYHIRTRMQINGGSVEERQMKQAEFIRQTVKDLQRVGVHIESVYYSMRICDFFSEKKGTGGEYIALGTVCHMIQDGFASSHARRVYNVFSEDPEMSIDSDKTYWDNNIKYFRMARNDAQQWLLNIQKQIMPVMLFADYLSQDSARHAYADVFLGLQSRSVIDSIGGFFSSITDDKPFIPEKSYYNCTANAELAKECTALFLWLTLNKVPQKTILAFIEAFYPLADAPTQFPPTPGGYPYEKTNFKPEDSGRAAKYARTILQDVGPNAIESKASDRILQLQRHIQMLDELLTACRGLVYEQVYLRHLNEITLELHEMEKLVKANSYNAVCKQIEKPIREAIEEIRQIYLNLSLANPLIMDAPPAQEKDAEAGGSAPEQEVAGSGAEPAGSSAESAGSSAESAEGSASLFEKILASALARNQSGTSYTAHLTEEFGGEDQRGNVAKLGQSLLSTLNG